MSRGLSHEGAWVRLASFWNITYLKSGRSRPFPLQLWAFPAKTSAWWRLHALLLCCCCWSAPTSRPDARSPVCQLPLHPNTSLCYEGGTAADQLTRPPSHIAYYSYRGPVNPFVISLNTTWTPRYRPPTAFAAREETSPILCLGAAPLAP